MVNISPIEREKGQKISLIIVQAIVARSIVSFFAALTSTGVQKVAEIVVEVVLWADPLKGLLPPVSLLVRSIVASEKAL
jgi:hypothetical protein